MPIVVRKIRTTVYLSRRHTDGRWRKDHINDII